MSSPVRIEETLYNEARWYAKAECRTISGQIEFWAKVGKAALENPDLPIDFVKDLLVSKYQDRALAEPFIPEGSN